MQVLKFHVNQPAGGTDVTRLWLSPGSMRVAVVFGNTLKFNGSGLCWDAAAKRALWEADLQDGDDTYPDPDFDRDLTRVVYTLPPTFDEGDEGSADYGIGFRDIPDGPVRLLGAVFGHLPAITPDGRYALASELVGPRSRGVRRWPLPSGGTDPADVLERDPKWTIRLPVQGVGVEQQFGGAAAVLAVAPDGKQLAVGRQNGSVAVWNVANRRTVATFPALKGLKYVRFAAHRLVFSAAGGMLAAVRGRWANKRYGYHVHVWALPGGELLRGPKEKANVHGVAFSPDGRTLLTAREDGSVGEWDTATWKLRREFAWKIGKLFSVAFAPDGLTCAAGGEDGQVVVWDVDG